jgi:iron complex outermembrane receptor protein
LIFNVDKARSQGVELEVTASPTNHLDLSFSASLNDSKLRSTVLSAGQPVSGMKAGNRLPAVPQVQLTTAVTYQWQVSAGARGFITGTYQHVGSRFTAIDDHGRGFCFPVDRPICPFGTVDMERFDSLGGATIGGPVTQREFRFNPELPAYDLVNLRVGVIRADWELAVFLNNLTDERAFLALDRERQTGARVGFLTNQPRTMGVTLRFNY